MQACVCDGNQTKVFRKEPVWVVGLFKACCIVALFKVDEGGMRPVGVAWLNGAGSVLQVPEDEHGL